MSRRRRRTTHYTTSDISSVHPIFKLWLLRLLVPLECHRQLIGDDEYLSDEIATLFELPGFDDSEMFDGKLARKKLIALHRTIEKQAADLNFPEPLDTNLKKLASLVGLNNEEQKLLGFAILLDNYMLLSESCEWLGRNLNPSKLFNSLSILLDIPADSIRTALASSSTLAKTALLTIEKDYKNNELADKISILSRSFAERLMGDTDSPIEWLRDMILLSQSPHLSLDNYPYLKNLDLLSAYLSNVIKQKKHGVNVFIYGKPGTGKTQLARLLVSNLNCPLYEVTSEDEDGDSIDGEQRLCTVRAAQVFLKNTSSFLLFDEVEDIFDNHGNRKFSAQSRKAWMNRLLEENPVPTFWLCNNIDSIDPAFMRRFDWVIELPVPPKAQREKIIRESCSNFLTNTEIQRLSGCEELAPAIVTRATKVMNTLTEEFTTDRISDGLHYLMNSTLVAQGHSGIYNKNANHLPDVYDPELINCDADLMQIANGIKQHGNARLCLFGIPGTGKSAYARWLAEYLDKPLHVKRGSDLLSKWVGETEKNIERIFRAAQEEKALLLIDEVDSFLQDRNMSEHSWEVTAVNEMLTRMEVYDGVFIASTNRLDGLDAASLRRFDLKIKFDALKPKQAWKLLQRYALFLGLPEPNATHEATLQKIDSLTPGDFAVLNRQHRFRPIDSVDALLEALKAECAIKNPHQRQPIGFI